MIRYAVYDRATGVIQRLCRTTDPTSMARERSETHAVLLVGEDVLDTTHRIAHEPCRPAQVQALGGPE